MPKLPGNKVLTGLLIAACFVVISMAYLGFISSNNPVEKAAVEIIKLETGVDIVVPEPSK